MLTGQDLSKTEGRITYRGVVMDNNDPHKIGRVRLAHPVIYTNVPTADLPWATNEGSPGFGGDGRALFFFVPNIQAEVWFYLEDNDPHRPRYLGATLDPTSMISAFTTNYPHRWGFLDEQGTGLLIDRKTKDLWVKHVSGFEYHVDTNGNATVNIPGTETLTVGGDATLHFKGNVNATIDKDLTSTVSGNMTTTVDKDASVTVNGSLTAQIGTTQLLASTGSATLKGSIVNITGATINLQGEVVCTASIAAAVQVSAVQVSDSTGSMSQVRTIYDSHSHPGDSGGTTGTPNQQM